MDLKHMVLVTITAKPILGLTKEATVLLIDERHGHTIGHTLLYRAVMTPFDIHNYITGPTSERILMSFVGYSLGVAVFSRKPVRPQVKRAMTGSPCSSPGIALDGCESAILQFKLCLQELNSGL